MLLQIGHTICDICSYIAKQPLYDVKRHREFLIAKNQHTYCEPFTFLHGPYYCLLPTGSEEGGVLGGGSIPVAILPFCQDMKTIVL